MLYNTARCPDFSTSSRMHSEGDPVLSALHIAPLFSTSYRTKTHTHTHRADDTDELVLRARTDYTRTSTASRALPCFSRLKVCNVARTHINSAARFRSIKNKVGEPRPEIFITLTKGCTRKNSVSSQETKYSRRYAVCEYPS